MKSEKRIRKAVKSETKTNAAQNDANNAKNANNDNVNNALAILRQLNNRR